MSNRTRYPRAARGLSAGVLVVATIALACSTEPTSPALLPIGEVAFAKPVNCDVSVNLAITMRDAVGDAVTSDGGVYLHGVDGVVSHLSGVNGNLMLSVQQSATRRIGYTTSEASGQSDDRLYTNSHTNPGGNNACGLDGMVVGSTGSSVVSFELWQGNREDIVHYGKNCNGSGDASTRVTTSHPDADTWVITGASGRHCRAGNNGKYSQVGTAGSFEMTLVRQ